MHKLYIFSAIIFCTLTIQSAERSTIKSVNEQVNDLVFSDCSRFSHEDLMNFGLACKSNHKYLCDTIEQRKNYFLMLMPMTDTRYNSFQWHGYGSRADRKEIKINPSEEYLGQKILSLERLELSDSGKIYKYLGEWSDFEAELVCCRKPFLDKEKRLCFFGYGYIEVPYTSRQAHVICYRLERTLHNEDSSKQAVKCVFSYNDDNAGNEESLSTLLGFFYLLKSILISSPSEKKYSQVAFREQCYFLYDIKNIVLPDNYKEFVQHESKSICCQETKSYKTFGDLPERLKTALSLQYSKQKQKQ